ncbi:uncharacterized protein VTP21DRAFT_7125 [Calcarisporiella thermophila]|uniref:uncharacterized protein n=1 Tax=Calcarisporiella thermophila TaxID=911321 RepID=UPI00374220C3
MFHETNITSLPFEVLSFIFILSENPQLPYTCRLLYQVASHEHVRLEWLLQRYGPSPIKTFYKGVRWRFFNLKLLHYLDTRYQQENKTQEVIPFKDRGIPRHFFSRIGSDTESNKREAAEEMIRLLLDRGASPDKPSGYPLIKSAKLGRADLVKLLLDKGAQIDLRDNMALRVCALEPNWELVRLLIDRGVKPDSLTLQVCVEKNMWDMVDLLIDHGAIPNMETLQHM